jgi:lipopolysaccharide transport system ATP-binding protein
MSDSSIIIENLSKQYRLGTIGTGTLTHDLKRWWAGVRGKEDPMLRIGAENRLSEVGGQYVWALRNISLNIPQGEVLGIIGKNGAGKSTLLKILSRITSPTEGYVKMHGRVASLLEVGTGFHGELTGRENVFLNGAILGMTKQEIKLRFDEIVEFAGVGKYIDTPVKRYSSGMYVRLAFAVAAHLDPEIMVVDEVLAVGDVEFQKKALGKMQEVNRGTGRTVLFVSHNMSAVQNLCKNCLLLNNGQISHFGPSEETINEYLKVNKDSYMSVDLKDLKRKGEGRIILTAISIKQGDQVISGSTVDIMVKVRNQSNEEVKNFKIDLGIDNHQALRIAHLSSMTLNKTLALKAGEEAGYTFSIPGIPLIGGRYGLTFYCEAEGQIQDWIKNVLYFEIESGDFYGTGKLPPNGQGMMLLHYDMEQMS